MKFSSHVRYVPHGVKPIAQLLNVPSTAVPVGSAAVCSSGWPAAGPVMVIGVVAVMRRANARWAHDLPPAVDLRRTSMIADAVGGLGLGGLLGVPVGDAVGEEEDVVGVLVVLHDQTAAANR